MDVKGVCVVRHAQRAFRSGAVLLWMGLLAGCTSLPSPVAPEVSVAARAKARWEAVIAGNWQQAYEFATPAYRAAVSVDSFRARTAGPVQHKSVEVRSVKCESAVCELKLMIGFAPLQKGFPDLNTELGERWVLEEGEWWRFETF